MVLSDYFYAFIVDKNQGDDILDGIDTLHGNKLRITG